LFYVSQDITFASKDMKVFDNRFSSLQITYSVFEVPALGVTQLCT
jgi:hypothetical protein